MPCHNSALSIDATLKSVAKQHFKDFELIAVDDASTDNTLTILEQWKSRLPVLTIIQNSHNLGPGRARNIGISCAQSNLIALLDSDDYWLPEKLAVQVQKHISGQATISCTSFLYRGREVVPQRTGYVDLLKNNVVNTSTVMFDSSRIGIKFESSEKSEDYIAWLDVAKRTTIHQIKSVLVVRNDIEGISGNKLKMAQQRWKIYRQIEKLSLFDSAYYFLIYAFSGTRKHLRCQIFGPRK